MKSFYGRYSHTIDPKGRLIVPSKYRDTLGEAFVVTCGLDNCLVGYDMEDWEAYADKIKALPTTNEKARRFTRFTLGNANVCEVDKQGRILLPPHLRDYAGLEKEVVFVGVGQRIEIWNKKTLEGAEADLGNLSESMEDLGI